MFVRNVNEYDVKEVSRESAIFCPEPTKTEQSSAEEADINTIVRKFGVTGLLPTNFRVPIVDDYRDFVFDYQSALNIVREADMEFMKMPADMRAKFNNDPQLFLDFCSDANNVDEMVKMGLAVKKEEPEVVPPAPREPNPPA